MWIEKTPQGKYKAVERYKDPLTGKDKRVSIIIEKDTPKARKAAQAALAEKIAAATVCKSSVTFKELTDYYLADKKRAVRPSSCKTYSIEVDRLLTVIDKDIRTDDLTAGYINKVLKSVSEDTANVNWYIKAFKRVVAWGYQNDYISSKEWLDKITLLKDSKKARTEDKYLEPEELVALVDAMKLRRWKLLTRFLALTGMRIGEAIALAMDDIDKDYIHIRRTYQLKIRAVGDKPKTADSERDIYIQPELRSLLAEIRTYRLEEQMKAGVRSSLVFFGRKGEVVAYNSYMDYLRRISKNTIGRAISPHALRHTHVSILASQGVSFDTIARRLGHNGDAVTKEVYFHVTEKLREMDNQSMENTHII